MRRLCSRVHVPLAMLFLLLVLAACATAAPTPIPLPPTPTPVPPTPTPAMSAEEEAAGALWDQVTSADYASNWSTIPGKGTLYRGQGPHGMLLSTYLNPVAEEAMKNKPGVMPEGAIIVKENYKPNKTLAAITIMKKQPGFDADHNDWFWAKYGPDGKVLAAGTPAGCISCHGSVRSNDYIFTFPIAPITPPEASDTQAEARAQTLWASLQQANYADNWTTVPGKGTLYRGQGPHGMLLSTYLNPAAAKAMAEKPGSMPDGAIIVKENYKPDKTLAAITVMVKENGYSPEYGDWFWVKYAPDGSVQAAGQPAGCISCHGSVRSNDYIFTFPVAPISPEGSPPPVAMPKSTGSMGEQVSGPSSDDVATLVQKGGCGGCHMIPGIASAQGTLGPSWCDVAKEVQSGEVDRSYVVESIVNPNAVIAEGYPANVMPQDFGHRFSNEEIERLVDFIVNLSCPEDSSS